MITGYFRSLKTLFQNMLDAYYDDRDDERSLAKAGITLAEDPQAVSVSSLSVALYQKDHIGCATRGGQDRPGIRLSPHFYNTHADIDRTVAAIKKYMATGV